MMQKKLVIGVFLFISISVFGQNKSVEKINKVFEENGYNEENLIGSSFIAFKNDTLVFEKSFGYSDIENKIPFTGNTLIGIGSLSKMYTSIAIMQLIDKKKLNYETTLGDLFKDIPAYCKTISIRNLLEHSSGLPVLFTTDKIKEKFYFDYKESFNYFKDFSELAYAPGERQAYNQMDYAILALVVEKVSKKTFAKYLAKYIAKPLGLKNTGLNYGETEIKNGAKRYFINREKEIEQLTDFKELLPVGFTGIYTTPNEFVKFLEGVHHGELVNLEHLKIGFTMSYYNNLKGKDLPRFSFAGINKEIFSISHKFLGGADAGYSIILLRVPYDNTTVVVFTNNAGLFGMYRLASQVSNAFSKVFIPIAPAKN